MEEIIKQIEFIDKHLENFSNAVKYLEDEKIKLYKRLNELKTKN